MCCKCVLPSLCWLILICSVLLFHSWLQKIEWLILCICLVVEDNCIIVANLCFKFPYGARNVYIIVSFVGSAPVPNCFAAVVVAFKIAISTATRNTEFVLPPFCIIHVFRGVLLLRAGGIPDFRLQTVFRVSCSID